MCNRFSRVYFQIGLSLNAANYIYHTSCLAVNREDFQMEERELIRPI